MTDIGICRLFVLYLHAYIFGQIVACNMLINKLRYGREGPSGRGLRFFGKIWQESGGNADTSREHDPCRARPVIRMAVTRTRKLERSCVPHRSLRRPLHITSEFQENRSFERQAFSFSGL